MVCLLSVKFVQVLLRVRDEESFFILSFDAEMLDEEEEEEEEVVVVVVVVIVVVIVCKENINK